MCATGAFVPAHSGLARPWNGDFMGYICQHVSNPSFHGVLAPPCPLRCCGGRAGPKAVPLGVVHTGNEDGRDCVHGQLEACFRTMLEFTFLPVGVLGGEADTMGAWLFPRISR